MTVVKQSRYLSFDSNSGYFNLVPTSTVIALKEKSETSNLFKENIFLPIKTYYCHTRTTLNSFLFEITVRIGIATYIYKRKLPFEFLTWNSKRNKIFIEGQILVNQVLKSVNAEFLYAYGDCSKLFTILAYLFFILVSYQHCSCGTYY